MTSKWIGVVIAVTVIGLSACQPAQPLSASEQAQLQLEAFRRMPTELHRVTERRDGPHLVLCGLAGSPNRSSGPPFPPADVHFVFVDGHLLKPGETPPAAVVALVEACHADEVEALPIRPVP